MILSHARLSDEMNAGNHVTMMCVHLFPLSFEHTVSLSLSLFVGLVDT